DGTVLGDTDLDAQQLKTIENHATRPEIQQARREGLGIARRFSSTVHADMLYVAVPVHNPDVPQLSEVRLAMPLTAVAQQLSSVRRLSLIAFGSGLVLALLVSWTVS